MSGGWAGMEHAAGRGFATGDCKAAQERQVQGSARAASANVVCVCVCVVQVESVDKWYCPACTEIEAARQERQALQRKVHHRHTVDKHLA